MKEACPLPSPGNCNSFSWPAPFLACSSCLLLSARYPMLLHRMQVWLRWKKPSFPTTNRAPEGCFPAKERHPPESNPKSPIQTTVEWNAPICRKFGFFSTRVPRKEWKQDHWKWKKLKARNRNEEQLLVNMSCIYCIQSHDHYHFI